MIHVMANRDSPVCGPEQSSPELRPALEGSFPGSGQSACARTFAGMVIGTAYGEYRRLQVRTPT